VLLAIAGVAMLLISAGTTAFDLRYLVDPEADTGREPPRRTSAST